MFHPMHASTGLRPEGFIPRLRAAGCMAISTDSLVLHACQYGHLHEGKGPPHQETKSAQIRPQY